MAHGIFISYRREDSQYVALAICHALALAFGEDEVFIDRMDLLPGVNYESELQQRVQQARVVVAVIGPGWLRSLDDAGQRRIDDSKDWVRRELAAALQVPDKLLPVLVQEFGWPSDPRLPTDLAGLNTVQGLVLRAELWRAGMYELVQSVHRAGLPLRPPRSDDPRNPDGSPVLTRNKPAAKQAAEAVLSDQELADARAKLPDWTPEWNPHPWGANGMAHELCRRLEFNSFREAMDFMHAIAPAFDRMKPEHHPRWQQQWCAVTVWFTSWDVDCRITRLDVAAAKEFNLLYAQYLVAQASAAP